MKSRLVAIAFAALLFAMNSPAAEAQTCIAGPCTISPNCVQCMLTYDTYCGCYRGICEPIYSSAQCGCVYPNGPDCQGAVGNCQYYQCQRMISGICTPSPWEPPQRTSRSTRVVPKLPREGALLSGASD